MIGLSPLYKFPEENVVFTYSRGNCDRNDAGWNVPANTIIEIEIIPQVAPCKTTFSNGTCIAIILSVILLSARSPQAQQADLPPAISLDFRCPTYPVSGAQPLKLFADILGTEDPELVRPLVFRWIISGGKIESGQGTTEITIAGPDSNRNELGVNLLVEGGPPELGNEKTCVVRVNSSCLLAPKIDQYGAIPIDQEIQHLDRFAEHLKASPPESIGYVFSYAGKKACIYEADWRLRRALQYLVEKHNIPTKRLVTVDGGFRDDWAVELFIQPNAACGPLPEPTRKRVQVRVRGRCG